jgi:hypothetical protein
MNDINLFTNDEKETGTEWLKNNAPAIAFWFGNILLVMGEWRVYDYVLRATEQPWKAVFAVFSTFIPFLLWEFTAQHKKNTGGMILCAVVGIMISLGLGVSVGVADFVLLDGQPINSDAILTALALGLSAHAVLFLLYFYQHPDIQMAYITAVADGQEKIRNQRAEKAREMLKQARENLQLENDLAKDFGAENARRALAQLQGKKYEAPKAQPQVRPAYGAEVEAHEGNFTPPRSRG